VFRDGGFDRLTFNDGMVQFDESPDGPTAADGILTGLLHST
jgi:hypothetical protein